MASSREAEEVILLKDKEMVANKDNCGVESNETSLIFELNQLHLHV